MSRSFRIVYVYILVLVILVLTSVMLVKIKASHPMAGSSEREATPTDAAFRDGLYQGKLDAAAGRPEHVSVGRWNQAKDRKAFSAGYQRSYQDESTAARETPTTPAPNAKGTLPSPD